MSEHAHETKYKIEHGIPVPPVTRVLLGPKRRKYPLNELAVGTSFLTEPGERGVVGASSAYSHVMRKKGETVRFSVRKQPDGRYRVWRVA